MVDECHRLAADRFDALVTAVRPSVLLGLTATPERSDGQPIAQYFDARPDGSPAVELRLWHGLDLQLLAPFEYYACDDGTDFSAVPWDKPGEREALDKLVTANDVRARLVVNEGRRLASDASRSRAIVFCVSVAHAEFMTDWLNRAGLPAACVVGATASEERSRAPQRLLNGELCAMVTVDLYNEGIDLPMVDTLLLLRPTQSRVCSTSIRLQLRCSLSLLLSSHRLRKFVQLRPKANETVVGQARLAGHLFLDLRSWTAQSLASGRRSDTNDTLIGGVSLADDEARRFEPLEQWRQRARVQRQLMRQPLNGLFA